MSLTKTVAKKMMLLAPGIPPEVGNPTLSQTFNHDSYRFGTDQERRSVRADHSQYRFDYEQDVCFFDHFFPDYPRTLLRGKDFLDLGCLTGGRTAAWFEKFGFRSAFGFDIDPEFVRAAKEFAEARGNNSGFCVSIGEQMPIRDGSFDVVASYDVIEHVQNPADVFSEAWRVLRPGGAFFVVFPTHFQPLESHLGLATRMVGLLNLFPGRIVAEAFYETIAERGPDHAWYNSSSPELPEFYRSPFLNGITVRDFNRILKQNEWEVVDWPKRPILSVGRRSRHIGFRIISTALTPLARLPLLDEVFLSRVSCILRKPS